MKTTPNLGLRKPDGTDYVLIGDFNTNADTIDSTIGNLGHLETIEKTNLVLAINEALKSGGENAPYIGRENYNWWIWDTSTARFIDTGVRALGEAAGFGIPTASAETVSPETPADASISATGPNTEKEFTFRFKIPQGFPGREVEFQKSSDYIQWRYAGDTEWFNLVALKDIIGPDGRGLVIIDFFATFMELQAAVPYPNPGDAYGVGVTFPLDIFIYGETAGWINNGQLQGPSGLDGREIVLRVTDTYIQWQYSGEESWSNLISLAAIMGADGREIELQKNAAYIQWRYIGSEAWHNLIPLSDITGAAGEAGPNQITAATTTNISGLLKGNGSIVSAAVPNTDYAAVLHAQRHMDGGDDEITPEDIGAAEASTSHVATLLTSGWTNNLQTVYVGGMTSNSNGFFNIAASATDEQFEAGRGAELTRAGQGANALIIRARGDVPTVDVPIEILIVG